MTCNARKYDLKGYDLYRGDDLRIRRLCPIVSILEKRVVDKDGNAEWKEQARYIGEDAFVRAAKALAEWEIDSSDGGIK